MAIAEERAQNIQIMYAKRMNELKQRLKKYDEAVSYYRDTGEALFMEMINNAQKSYEAGEIDIFQYLLSMEAATNIRLEYLRNLWQGNLIILEMNYFTL